MFGPSFPLFRIFGFQVKADLSWLVIAVLVTWSLAQGVFPRFYPHLPQAELWAMGVVGALGLFLSIVLHELGHSIIAEQQGLPMHGITLFIFGGVAEMTAEPPSAKAEFFIAIAGPIVSVVIGLIFGGLWFIQSPPYVRGVIAYISIINLALVAFNLIPAFPLDGGRVLRSILWYIKGDLRWASRIAAWIGGAFGILLIAGGAFRFFTGFWVDGIWWVLIGMFLRRAASMSYQHVLARNVLEGKPIRNFMDDHPRTVPPTITVAQFIDDYAYRHHLKMFPVADDGRLIGEIQVDQIRELPREQWPWHDVREYAVRASPDNSVKSDADAMAVLMNMNRARRDEMMVVDDGHLLGIARAKDLAHQIALRRQLER